MVRGRRIGAAGMVKAARIIPPAVRDKQASASNPGASSFVSANAGSGKTHVLVQRVIRLLLTGVPPEKILCITFTKAAAANMAERVFTTLGHWVTLDDAALDAAIADAGVPHPDKKLRRIARELFAQALETPGGLKVQTIHALCTRLLQQFPFEANVPARFAVLDERDQADMMERANLKVFLEAAAAPESTLGRALLTAMANAADVTFKDVVREACLARDHFMAWTDAAGSAQAAAAQVSAGLGVSASDSIESVEREIVDGPYLPRKRWLEIAAAFGGGSKTDQKQADQLRASLAFTGSAQVDEYLCVFLTDDKAPRANVLTKGFIRDNPAVAHLFEQEIDRLKPLVESRRAVVTRDRTEALLHIAISAAANYRREKDERGLLDYDDLIDKTLAMLNKVSAGWVHYKLDRGVDHVLIDEAQDTSPRQWDIVDYIISEFTAGKGSRENNDRTLFAVGDEKQSIFSFQGAAPREFDLRRRKFEQMFTGAGLQFNPISFNYSFRSGAAILQSVDHVFRDEAIYRSIHAENAYPLHHALDDAGPGLIELWPLVEADKRDEIEGWRAPFDGVSVTSPEVKLSKRIQAEIKRLVTSGTLTGPAGNRRPLTYGDVLVLVRRRGNLFDAVIQALKHASIPVAGADRLKLTEHIAIIDLINLADALLLPSDDLALAVALKSPLFGLDEDDLFVLAHNRKGSLRKSLSQHVGEKQKFEGVLKRLEECERRFIHDTPFAFYAWLLGGDGGRARILARLGHEANDALDEFLELALNYERKAPASLQGFMAWLRSADTEVKRDMEISRDEVRVMTVHGAKGLEAPVVIMVDTTSSPSDTQRLRLIQLPHEGREVTVWAGKKADDPKAVEKGPRGDARRDRARISPPALCRDDARRRPADCGRYPARQPERRARPLLVRPGPQGSGQFRAARGNHRHRRGPDQALHPRRRWSAFDRRGRASRDHSAGVAVVAADAAAHASDERRPAAPIAGKRRYCASREVDGSDRAADAGLAAGHAGASPAAVAACTSSRAAARRGTGASRPQCAGLERDRARSACRKSDRPDRRFALRRRVRRRQPGRGGNRRAARTVGAAAGAGIRPDRPPRGHAKRGFDRRFQDQSRSAQGRRRGAAGLSPPACAVPDSIIQALSPARHPRRAALDRNG